MRLRAKRLYVLGALAPGAAACSAIASFDGFVGSGADAGVLGPDGGADAPAIDSSVSEAGPRLRCGEGFVASCSECALTPFLCRESARCVASCKADCAPAEIECIACSASGVPVDFVCEAPDAGDECTRAPSREHCPCDADAAACPGARQICADGGCLGCGEPGTNGMICKGPPLNKHCDADPKGKLEENYTCR